MNIETAIDACIKCGDGVWDNRKDKKNPKGPDFKCKSKSCGAAYWLAKPRTAAHVAAGPTTPEPEWLQGQDAEEAAFVTKANGAAGVERYFAHYDKCFAHAIGLAARAEKTGVVVTLDGVSAIAATLYIATKSAL